MQQKLTDRPVLTECFSSPICSGSLCWLLHGPWKFPDTNILFIYLSPQLFRSLFQVLLEVLCWLFSLPRLYFLPGQAHSDSWFEHTLPPNEFPTLISSPDPFVEFQGSNSKQTKSVSKFLSNLHYLSHIKWNYHHMDPEPKVITLPLSTSSLLHSTSIMDHFQIGFPFASLLSYIAGISLSPLFFQFIPTSHLPTLFSFKSQCFPFMFKTHLSLDSVYLAYPLSHCLPASLVCSSQLPYSWKIKTHKSLLA